MIGQTIDAILRFYRTHWQSYLALSFAAHLWAIAMFVSIFLSLLIPLWSQNSGLTVLAIPAGILGFLYSQGMFRVNALTISRLAVGELAGQPETPQMAFREVRRSLWPLLGLDLMIGVICSGIYFAISTAADLLLSPIHTVFNNIPIPWDVALNMYGIFARVLGSMASLGLLWLFTRLSLSKLHYVLDAEHPIGYALKYSMFISERQFLHIIAHNMLIWLLSNILSLVCLLGTLTGLWTLGGLGQFLSQNIFSLDPNYFSLASIYLGSVAAVLFLPNIVSLPIRQIAKGSLYYSLRMKTANSARPSARSFF
jgi:hypothetical protein